MSIGSGEGINHNGTSPTANSNNISTIIITNNTADADAVTSSVPMEVVHENIPSTDVLTTADVITSCSSHENGMTTMRKHVPIAILGYSYRLPGGLEKDDDFFNLLAERGYVQELIEDRYGVGSTPWDGFGHDHPCSLASPWEGLIRGGKELEFDCALFGISVHDAKRMDPQIKLMLMATWEALQCAGMDQAALHNSNTGVFTGIQTSSISGWRPLYGAKPGDVPGKSGSMIANRISFHFNWMGPSFSVATACSSGITALDVAVKSLDVRECDLAAFGAVHYLGYAMSSVGFNALGIISSTGSSRSFDKDANGYMRSEGAFVYILKRLEDAERDGDRIFGVIRGCALNCAGAEQNAEILTQGRMIVAPVMHAQQKLMQQIVDQVEVDPTTVDYIEAHATGTVLGDAIEGNAIANVYGSENREFPLRLSSVRSNIGHMEAGSFTCSLLKVLLMFQKRKFLPVSSHHKEATDKIPFEAKNMRVQTEVEDFPIHPDGRPVRIGVNSFGFGGANGHCLLEEYNLPDRNEWSTLPGGLLNKVYTVPFSAKSEEALVENARLLATKMDDLAEQVDMYTLVANLSVRMTHHRVRTSLTAATMIELKDKLAAFAERSDLGQLKEDEMLRIQLHQFSDKKASERGNILMIFPGQGSQWAGCGRELYETEIVFRRVVDEIDLEWMKLAGCKLSDIAFDPEVGTKLNDCCWAQPVTFLLQVAMYELFIYNGIHPKAVMGHSAGEPSAAYAAGAYTLSEACYLVYHRSRLQNTLAGCGRMLVLMMDSTSTENMINRLGFQGSVEIACYNSPSNTVVCAAEDVIMQLRDKLEAEGQPTGTLIAGNIAFHSQHMMPIKDALFESLSVLDDKPRTSRIPMISTVSGLPIKNFDAEYWWSNVRQAVDLLSGMATAHKNVQPQVIVEISSHITLRSPVRDYYTDCGEAMPNYVFTLVRNSNTADMFAQAIGSCFKLGLPVNFRRLYPRPYPCTHLLPHYVMKLEQVIDPNLDYKFLTKKDHCSAGPLLGRFIASDHLSFEGIFSKKHYLWMADHIVQGQPLVPAAAYLELIFEAFKGQIIHMESVRILHPFVLTNDTYHMYTDLVPCQFAANQYEFKIYSRLVDQTTDHKLHVLGVVRVIEEEIVNQIVPESVTRNITEDTTSNYNELLYKDKADFYATMSARIGQSFGYGPYFQGVSKVELDRKQNRVRIEVTIDKELWACWDKMGYIFHPSVFDGALQSFLVYLMESSDFAGIPQMLKNLVLVKKATSEKIVVIYEAPEYLRTGQFHQKGQLAFALGERSAGNMTIYDAVTGDLLCYVGDHTSYGSNSKVSDLRKVKHYLSWQPKDDVKAETTIVNAVNCLSISLDVPSATKALISDIISSSHPDLNTPFFLNAAECLVGAIPEKLVMEDCLPTLTNESVQYAVIASDSQYLSDSYQKFGGSNSDANLRFASVNDDLSKGFLRAGMFELMIIRLNLTAPAEGETSDYSKETTEYERLSSLAAPGCIIVVECNGIDLDAPASWTSLYKSDQSETGLSVSIFKAPSLIPGPFKSKQEQLNQPELDTDNDVVSVDNVSIVIDDDLGFSEFWKENVQASDVVLASEVDFEKATTFETVDYFAMYANSDSVDIFDGPSKLTDFVREMSIRRSTSKDNVPCMFTVFTSGAMLAVSEPSQTGIWGAIRSLALEVGSSCSMDFRVVDVATKEDLLFVPSCQAMRERELCIHNGRLWTCRLINNREMYPTTSLSSDDESAFKLITTNSGLITDLHFRAEELPPLKPTEVEIAVKAAALNFRDIMIGLGKLPLLSFEASMLGRTVGMECSGVVVRCGSAVTDHKVGDKVLAMQGGCIANRINCHEKAAYKLPTNLTFEEGSAVASVYVTAYYALVHLARMTTGTNVLVHSALGGVGQAAIALAKLYGANIYGTAGSEEKRQVLRDMGCVDAFDSHSTKWYSDLMASTNGRGVDIVLNSLAGEHVDLCLEALTPGGFHCEIGKVDIFMDRPLKMAVFRKNIAYRAIDVDRLMTDDPRLTYELTATCLKLIEEGKVPPLPCTLYSYQNYHDALRCMMNGQHRGKLVMTPPADGETINVVDDRKVFGTGKDGTPRTVLMTGCLGGFGLRVLAYVVALGARNIVLLDRDPERKRTVEWVMDNSYISILLGDIKNLRIEIVYGDVGVYDHVVNAVTEVEKLGMPAIGSIFHLAGILDDKKVEDMNRESFAKVYQPKANGAWNLHRATESFNTIDHFVMFSSTSSAFGNPGQTNYSAANSFQDGLAAMRLAQGKPALSFCMGAVIEAGMAARSNQLLQMMKAGGMPAISCIFAIESLDSAIRGPSRYNAVAALAKDLPANFDSPDYLRTSAQLIRNNAAFKMGDNSGMSREALIDILSERVGKLCGVEKLDPTEPFSSYGLNSISVAELATYLKNEMNYTVSAMELMTSATCESIADGIIQAQLGKPDETDNKESDDGTAETGDETDSGSSSTEEEDHIWSEPVVQQQSLFAPTMNEYFAHPPRMIKEFSKQAITPFLKVDSGKVEKEKNSVSDPLGSIDDKMPQPCQEQLNELTSYLDKIDTRNIGEAVSARNIKRVVLTGATGFVGRHFVAELLNVTSNYIETIYCPIRATSDDAAMERLVTAMKESETWNESFRPRLKVFCADLNDECMGVSPDLYEELVGEVDAVYHFASNLSLTASFQDLQSNNCSTMRSIFKLCLTIRHKHLFLASTLGIFPQYFCLFSNEMADKPVHRSMMPEVSLMKQIFPLAIGGYPWSKLINEIACYKAMKTKGLQLAVFRLPVMFTNSKTGYSVDGDPWVRLFFATLQLRLVPGQGRDLLFDDSAPSNEMMLRISLNPDRKNVVYHCTYHNHTVPTEAPLNDMMGFPCVNTSYENFKSQCLKLGSKSPVNAYWTLLDQFSSYWVNFKRYAAEYPIDVSTVEEDCVPLPRRSNSLAVFCKCLDWVSRQDAENAPLNIALLNPSMDVESLLVPARKVCDMYDIEFNEVVKPYVIEGLQRICDELHVKKTMLPEVALSLTMRIEARIHLYRLIQMNPEIKEERIDSPVFILGLNRTGTTFLHRVLEASGRFECPHADDQLALPKAEDIMHPDEKFAAKRLSAITSFLEGYASNADGIHEVELGVAEEDMVAHGCSFMSLEYDVLYNLPKYRNWLESQELDPVYEEHKTWMQFISWWRRRQNPDCNSRWCYKLPWHLRSLKQLLKVYPDARLVHTHRDIKDVASSWCSLVKNQRKRFVDDIDDHELGQDQLKSLEVTLAAGIEFRKNNPQFKGKWLDVHYNQIVAAPVEMANRIVRHAGLEVNEETTKNMTDFVEMNISKRDKIILHQPKYQDYGITSKDFKSSVFRSGMVSQGPMIQLFIRRLKTLGLSQDQLLAFLAFLCAAAAVDAENFWVLGAACACLIPILAKVTV